MSERALATASDWASFRAAARRWLARGVPPDRIDWSGAEDALLLPLMAAAAPEQDDADFMLRVPRRALELGESVAAHREPAPWPWLYRVLWRVAHGERDVLEDAADADVARLFSMERAVRRDEHRMRAFVRFRAVSDEAGGERMVAWYQPQHHILRRIAPWFSERFPSMRWSLLTPDACVHWDGAELLWTSGVARGAAPKDDGIEAFWLSYYRSTFNPARARPAAMRSEMPVRFWRDMPETAAIGEMLREAPSRVQRMVEHAAEARRRAASSQPVEPLLPVARVEEPAARRAGPAPAMQTHTGAERWTDCVRVGVAGWDYPDWAGAVYPAGRDAVDRLRFIAQRFDLVEVNSTFYRPVSARAARGWLERTAGLPRFRLSAKLHRAFTHERMPWSDAAVRAVHEGMMPLREAGRLQCLLVQFPWSFRRGREQARHLRRVLDAFADYPLQVEVRHASWDHAGFRGWLHERGVGLASIDQPLFRDSLEGADHAIAGRAYLRLHGRNTTNWFRSDATRDERYDYLYSDAELLPWIERAHRLAEREDVESVDVVFNNHFRGQAVQNAEAFRALLHARQPGAREPSNRYRAGATRSPHPTATGPPFCIA